MRNSFRFGVPLLALSANFAFAVEYNSGPVPPKFDLTVLQ
jgi:hypothetical protein